ncbi:MAG: DUF4430 domain-containing protein [Candidatus Falkowbacteria bacterium]
MKTKSLVIIFILFLLITLVSGLVVYLTKEKIEPIVNEQPNVVKKQAETVVDNHGETATVATSTSKKIIQLEIIEQSPAVSAPSEEKNKTVMIVNGVKYAAAIESDSSVYDLMELLKQENKINFFGRDYSGLGFFVEEINGVKNNPSGENWVYYVNGQPAQVGVSNYIIKENNVIEWKYEKKSF